MPRFIPTCTCPLLRALGQLAAEHSVNVHSHIHEASARALAAGCAAETCAWGALQCCSLRPSHGSVLLQAPAASALMSAPGCRLMTKKSLQQRWRAVGRPWTRLQSLMKQAC